MSKKVLLLGGTGAIGIYLAPELLAAGFSVDATTRSEHKSDNKNLKYIQGDARDAGFLRHTLSEGKYDAVIDFMNYSTDEFQGRCDLLLNSCKHYIFISSYRVFAETEVITEESPQLLDIPIDKEYLKTDEYALAKARQEDILRNEAHQNWTIVRPGITYSSSRFQLGTMEANCFVWRALQNLPVILPREMLAKYTTMTWAGDVASLMAKLVLNENAFGEDYNVATSEHHTWAEVVDVYSEIINLKIKPVGLEEYIEAMGGGFNNYQVRYDRMFDRAMDNTKILEVTGDKQKNFINLRVGLQRELKQFIKNPRFGGIDYALQARLDKLMMTKIDLSIASEGERSVYKENRFPRAVKLKRAIRPRTRMKKILDKIRILIRLRTRIRNLKEKIRYWLDWQQYRRADGVILTLNGYFNYGNIVQRFAFQEFLRQKGYSFLSYEKKPTNVSWDNPVRFKNTAEFVERNIRRKDVDPRDKFPLYIVGSDQVWRNWGYKNENADLGYFFLDFVSNPRAKRIAYAASIGQDSIEEAKISGEFVKYAASLLKQFDAISMRESSGVEIVRKTWKVNAERVIDPTMLLTATDYDKLIMQSPHKLKSTKPIFVYILTSTDEKVRIIEKTAKAKNTGFGGVFLDRLKVLPPVEQWLKGFRDAQLVITDSFHGAVLSIINNTPFIVIENPVGGVARITNLLSQFGLESRLVTENDAGTFKISGLKPIDWTAVNWKLSELREASSGWLLRELSQGKLTDKISSVK